MVSSRPPQIKKAPVARDAVLTSVTRAFVIVVLEPLVNSVIVPFVNVSVELERTIVLPVSAARKNIPDTRRHMLTRKTR